MNFRLHPSTTDLLWFARDREGHLAGFTTGGEGPIPQKIVDADDAALDAAYNGIHSLPKSTTATLVEKQMGRSTDWTELAERGLFAYDFRDVHRRLFERTFKYEWLATPTKPVLFNELPSDVAAALHFIPLVDAAFADLRHLDLRSYLPCHTPS